MKSFLQQYETINKQYENKTRKKRNPLGLCFK